MSDSIAESIEAVHPLFAAVEEYFRRGIAEGSIARRAEANSITYTSQPDAEEILCVLSRLPPSLYHVTIRIPVPSRGPKVPLKNDAIVQSNFVVQTYPILLPFRSGLLAGKEQLVLWHRSKANLFEPAFFPVLFEEGQRLAEAIADRYEHVELPVQRETKEVDERRSSSILESPVHADFERLLKELSTGILEVTEFPGGVHYRCAKPVIGIRAFEAELFRVPISGSGPERYDFRFRFLYMAIVQAESVVANLWATNNDLMSGLDATYFAGTMGDGTKATNEIAMILQGPWQFYAKHLPTLLMEALRYTDRRDRRGLIVPNPRGLLEG